VVLTAFASAENTIEAMRIGAFDHLTKPIGRQELRELLARMLARPAAAPPGALPDGAGGTLIGSSEPMRRVQKTIGLAADSDTTVLILARPVPARSWSRAPYTSMVDESTSRSLR
jgi:DNA-binding NtrC family response regulator